MTTPADLLAVQRAHANHGPETAVSEIRCRWPMIAKNVIAQTLERILATPVHREVVEALQISLTTERARHDAEIERLVGQFHAERSFWTERADAAECRAEQSVLALTDLVDKIMALIPTPAPPTSWWERWFGVSRR